MLKAHLEQEEAAAVMFTLADQDKAQELMVKEERKAAREEGIAIGKELGRAEGMEKGIAKGTVLGAIRVYHAVLKLPVPAMIEKVKADFGLSQENAEKYVDEALGTDVR